MDDNDIINHYHPHITFIDNYAILVNVFSILNMSDSYVARYAYL
jgi:hypothetical protein